MSIYYFPLLHYIFQFISSNIILSIKVLNEKKYMYVAD